MEDWSKLIFSNEVSFQEKARKVFDYQYEHTSVYRRYCEALGIETKANSGSIADNSAISCPLLPIRAFKDAEITTQLDKKPNLVFKSSGTSAMQQSVHQVMDASIYKQSLFKGFGHFYELESAVIWGYMPIYENNPHSSLIYMMQELILQDQSNLSRFLRLNEPLRAEKIKEVQESGKQLILFGAAFGLLDLLEMKKVSLPSNSIVIETGGMKTNRREISRKELHRKLAKGFGLDSSRIHSEYGMAELLSQAYATGSEWFHTVPWMKVSIRNPENPFEEVPAYSEGLIGIIDLANVYSCSFLLTGDRGMMDKKGRFQVMGRWNPKDLRGCNFLIEED
ncbi:MAG TPA: hypothetical protein VF181_07255 [Balneolaceae bacterium]